MSAGWIVMLTSFGWVLLIMTYLIGYGEGQKARRSR